MRILIAAALIAAAVSGPVAAQTAPGAGSSSPGTVSPSSPPAGPTPQGAAGSTGTGTSRDDKAGLQTNVPNAVEKLTPSASVPK